jgi:acyl carrier protein
MNVCNAEDIRKFILRRYSEQLSANGMALDAVPDDYDLMITGVIDSLGLIEMISAMEDEFNLEIDFEGLDADEMTIIGPFCRYVEKNGNPRLKT